MLDYTRVLYGVVTAEPLALENIGTTPVMAWKAGTDAYADVITDVNLTTFALASRIVDQIIAGTIPAPKIPLAIDVVVALVLTSPAYAVHYNGSQFAVVTPPPMGYVEAHNWMGWPNHPII